MFKGYYKDKYFLGNVTQSNAEQILKCRELKSIEKLKHIIVNVDNTYIDKYIKDTEALLIKNKEAQISVPAEYLKEGTLSDEQTIGVAFMYFAKDCILGDEVGLGKTVQASGLYNLVKVTEGRSPRCLFLTEMTPSVELRKKMVYFTGDYFHLIPSGQQHHVSKYVKCAEDGPLGDCNVVGTHALVNNSEFILYCAMHPFDMIIVDESWVLKNKKTDLYKNMAAILSTARRKILLNASTLELALEEVYAQFDILDKSYLPNKVDLIQRYHVQEMVGGKFETVGYKNTDEFKKAISLRYLERTRKTLNATYADNEVYCYSIPLSPVQKKLMSKTALKRLVCDYPSGVDRHVEFNTENVSKLDVLLKILQNEKFVTKKPLIYCAYKGCQEGLKEQLALIGKNACVVNGDTTQKKRVELFDAYKAGEYDVVITNIQRGLDLDCCDLVIIYSIDPNPQKMVQVEGRMTREFNVIGKTLILLVNAEHEQKKLQEVIAKRLQASNNLLAESSSLLNVLLKGDIKFDVWLE